jgi:hypothetical protein
MVNTHVRVHTYIHLRSMLFRFYFFFRLVFVTLFYAERCSNNCGVSVAVALADMHECETKEEVVVKRFRGVCGRQSVVKQSFGDQPRSPFRFFM